MQVDYIAILLLYIQRHCTVIVRGPFDSMDAVFCIAHSLPFCSATARLNGTKIATTFKAPVNLAVNRHKYL